MTDVFFYENSEIIEIDVVPWWPAACACVCWTLAADGFAGTASLAQGGQGMQYSADPCLREGMLESCFDRGPRYGFEGT